VLAEALEEVALSEAVEARADWEAGTEAMEVPEVTVRRAEDVEDAAARVADAAVASDSAAAWASAVDAAGETAVPSCARRRRTSRPIDIPSVVQPWASRTSIL
jgi:hypothetical protein